MPGRVQPGRDQESSSEEVSQHSIPKAIVTSNGIILDKDGKPCRSCNSYAAFASQSKSALKPKPPPTDCPPDVEALGRSGWTLLHSIAAAYPEKPSATQRSDLAGFVALFSRLYPCWVCADDFRGYLARSSSPPVGSRGEFGNWLCEAHNEVNRKLGKTEFDCGRWEERWRTGWKDGRCD